MLSTLNSKVQRIATMVIFGGGLLFAAPMGGCNDFMASFQQGFDIGQQLAGALESFESDSFTGEEYCGYDCQDDWSCDDDWGWDDGWY